MVSKNLLGSRPSQPAWVIGEGYGRGMPGVAEVEECKLHSHPWVSPPARGDVSESWEADLKAGM